MVEPLAFDLEVTPELWTIHGPASPPRRAASPLADARFRGLVASLREWAGRPVPIGRPDPLRTAEFVGRRALQVSARLTQVLLEDEDRRAVVQALPRGGRARLAIRVRSARPAWDLAADAALALPWELVAPEVPGSFPVRDGQLTVLREAVAEGSPDLPEPTGPLTLAVTIAAPEDRAGFPYEQEAFRLVAALSPLGQRAVFADLGSLHDLADLVADVRATAIHFRGHGLPGGLLFEDELGFAAEVPVSELRRRLATILLNPRHAGSFPRLFFLAAPFTAREPSPQEEPAIGPFDQESASAAALHRSGFAQVVGYFGPVDRELSTRLEERFYSALAAGRSTLDAAEEAREALLDPVGAAGEEAHYPFGWCQLAIYHRGPDRPLAMPGQGGRLPARFRRKTIALNGLPVLERGFIGRRELLHEIRRRLEAGRRLLVLQGLGGLGKTAVATQLLTRVLQTRPVDLLVLRCQEVEHVADPLLALRSQAEEHGRLHRLRVWDETVRDLRERSPEPAAGFVEVVRALRLRRPRLVIYTDNAESLQSGPRNGDPAALGSWKPAAEAWWHALQQLAAEGDEPILLSTRYLWRDLDERAWIGVGPMSRADCLRMIDSVPALGKLPLEVRMRLAERVDGHPRTVTYLDRLVAQRRRALGRRRVRDSWRELIRPVLPEQAEQITADLLLEEIWRRLSRNGRAHARRLSILVTAAPVFVIDHLGRARDELIRTGILTRFRQQVEVVGGSAWLDRWGFHALVKEHIARKTGTAQRRAAHRAAGEAYELRSDAPDRTRAEQLEGIYHLQAVGENERSWPLVLDLVLWRRHRGMYQEAREDLESFTRKPVKGEPMALALLLLCDIRQRQGESGPSLLKLLDRARKLSSSESTHALLLGTRGSLLMEQARYEEAETSLRQAAATLERILGRDNPDTLFAFSTLAEVLDRRGRLDEAEQLLTEVVRDWERTDPGHPERAATLKALAEALLAQGRYGEAEACLRKALAVQKEILVEDHPARIATLHTLAETLILQGRSEEAEALLRALLAQEERLQRASHPGYAMTLAVLADLLAEECRDEEAEALLRKALALTEKTRGKNHPDIAGILHPLAFILSNRNELQEAEKLLRRAIALSETGGTAHPGRGGLLMTLAQIREEQGQIPEAEELLRQALELARQDPAGQAHLLNALSQLLERQGRPAEAESRLREALALAEAPLGRRHWFYLQMMQNLAVLVDAQGRSEESEALVEEIQRLEDDGVSA